MPKNSGKSQLLEPVKGRPSPSLSSFDAGYSFSSPFNTLNHPGEIDFQVEGYVKGRVRLQVDLPEELLRGFVHFFEGAYELFRTTSRRTRFLQAVENAHDSSEQQRREDFKAEFDRKVCEVFDDLIKQGVPPVEAIKRTNQALKAENHPHASYDVVTSRLRALGRLKKIGLYKNRGKSQTKTEKV